MHTRQILLFTVLLLMTPALAMASTARLEGLGVIPDFVDDYANIFTYPVSITRYPGLVIGELGVYASYDRGFGATMALGKDSQYGTFGVMLRENSSFTPMPGLDGSEGSQFDLLWGIKAMDKLSIGLRFDNASSTYELTDEDAGGKTLFKLSPLYFYFIGGISDVTINDWNNWGMGLSAALDVRDGDMLEGAFEYRKLNFEVVSKDAPIGGTATEEKWNDNGNASYLFAGRGFFSVAENVSVVPLVGYSKYDYGWTHTMTDGTADAADQTLTTFKGGLGMKCDVGSMFMLGIMMSQTKAKTDFTYASLTPAGGLPETFEFTSSALPMMFGCLEAPVKDWLTVRFGARKTLVKEQVSLMFVDREKVDLTAKNGLVSESERSDIFDATGLIMPYFNEPFTFSLGVSFKFGDLDIDATMNDFYPFTGMYWLSGVDETPFSRISATYHY